MSTSEAETPSEGGHSPEELKLAFKAFKKTLKLARLDGESRLGVGPMSTGSTWGIVAIMPPIQYPRSVWDALVAQGKLKNAGRGMLSLVE